MCILYTRGWQVINLFVYEIGYLACFGLLLWIDLKTHSAWIEHLKKSFQLKWNIESAPQL